MRRYQQEVSDPKHRAETEAYLTQVEAEQRGEKKASSAAAAADGMDAGAFGPPAGPSGAELLKPKKGFVIKTWKRAPGRKDFDRTHGKVFINVCAHEDIEKPTSQVAVAPDGRRGETWSMPHLCSPKLKEEKDKSDHVCTVVDIVFNTEVSSTARRAANAHGMKPQGPRGALGPPHASASHELALSAAAAAGARARRGGRYDGRSVEGDGCEDGRRNGR